MNKPEQQPLQPVVRHLVEDAGKLAQSFGLGRALGQVYAFLYFSPSPRGLGDIQHALGISKGSASMTVRQLAQWRAVRKVWVKGDRKDYYEAEDWFGRILRNAVIDIFGKKIESWANLLDESDGLAGRLDDSPENVFVKVRLKRLRAFQSKAQKVWGSPIIRALLKA